jgi:hypothetical protein
MRYDKTMVASWITNNHINKIKEWIKKNESVLIDFQNNVIDDIDEFLERIEPL